MPKSRMTTCARTVDDLVISRPKRRGTFHSSCHGFKWGCIKLGLVRMFSILYAPAFAQKLYPLSSSHNDIIHSIHTPNNKNYEVYELNNYIVTVCIKLVRFKQQGAIA